MVPIYITKRAAGASILFLGTCLTLIEYTMSGMQFEKICGITISNYIYTGFTRHVTDIKNNTITGIICVYNAGLIKLIPIPHR